MKLILTESQYRMCLNEDFKTQKIKFIQQGYSEDIVNDYLNNFREIKDKKYKQLFDPINGIDVKNRLDIDSYKNFKDLEVVVDYVKGQTVVKNVNINKSDIKISGKPIYEDNNIIIYYADSPKACIEYKGSIPYSWCIARNDSSNMYHTYRYREHEPAFYFVKIKDRTKKELNTLSLLKNVFNGTFKDPYHFFVVQTLKYADIKDENKNQYYVTSANNDGDKHMSWNDIVKIDSRLSGLQHLFQPKPLSDEEKQEYKLFKNGVSDEEYCKLQFERKKNYINIRLKLSDKQFECTPDDLKNLYIGMGLSLTDYKYNIIKDNKQLLRRYVQITNRLIEEAIKNTDIVNKLTINQINVADKNLVKQLFIKVYKDSRTNEKWAKINLNGKANLVNVNGKLISNIWYKYIFDFKNGFVEVMNDENNWNLIKSNGDLISDIWFNKIQGFDNGFVNGFVIVENDEDKYNYINTDGKLISDIWFNEVFYFSNGFGMVQNDDYKYNYINANGELISNQWFNNAERFKNGFGMVRNDDNKHNYINTNGELISNQWFNNAWPFKNGFAIVQNADSKWNLINTNGKLLSNQWFRNIHSFNNNLYKVQTDDNKWKFIDTNGKLYDEKPINEQFYKTAIRSHLKNMAII